MQRSVAADASRVAKRDNVAGGLAVMDERIVIYRGAMDVTKESTNTQFSLRLPFFCLNS